jgi:prepilin-type N-terminal cleavage/methylation domain-containing protein
VRGLKHHDFRQSERGFTLPEVLIVIVLMGILFAIASSTWFGVVESRRVDSATNQLVSDLRLAHTKSTNQLATWQVVLNPDRADETAGADYSLVKLDSAGNPVAGSEIPGTLPDNVRLNSPSLLPVGGTRGIQFAADGSASAVGTLNLGAAGTDGCPAGTPTTGPRIRVTVDNSPMHCITFNTTTSRIQID